MGILKEHESSEEDIDYSFIYKSYCKIKVSTKNIDNGGFSMEIESKLNYDFQVEIPKIEEDYSTNGQLNQNLMKTFYLNKDLKEDDIIKLVGYFFEKIDSSLRNSGLKGVFNDALNKVLLFKPEVMSFKETM